jgi:cholinesterase
VNPHSTALARIKAGGPAWRSIYNGVYPNRDVGSKGAWHGADIGMQFGTSEFLSKKPNTEVQSKMEQTIMNAWTVFAKDPKEGLMKFGWPVYDDADSEFTEMDSEIGTDVIIEPTVISLEGRNDASVKFVDRKVLDAAC